MSHRLLRDASFWSFLFSVDEDLAERTRSGGCPCGGRLHRADYLRKPRGGPDDLSSRCRQRLSFCCDRDGCRRRRTPPSLRFLGPKVYLGAIVVLATAMRQGPTPYGLDKLQRLFGADRRTLSRWRVFWTEHFPESRFWKLERARLLPPPDAARLPLSLSERFFALDRQEPETWRQLLFFLSPITIPGAFPIVLSRCSLVARRGCSSPEPDRFA